MDPEEVRREMELQLEAWHKLPPGSQEEVSLVEEVQLGVAATSLGRTSGCRLELRKHFGHMCTSAHLTYGGHLTSSLQVKMLRYDWTD